MTIRAGVDGIPERKIETPWTAEARKRRSDRFLKGPISLSILRELSGQALKVYLAIVHRADLAGGEVAVLTNEYMAEWQIPPRTKNWALRALESRRLVAVDRRPGRAVRVTVLAR